VKRKCGTGLALGFCLCSLLILSGCDVHIGEWSQAKHERTVTRQAPLAPGSAVLVETKAGSIAVAGADVTDCNVTAIISTRAPTEEEARQIAEEVKIELEPVGQKLAVRAQYPSLKRNRSVSISFNVTVPNQTNVECTSSYGSIELTNLEGNARAKTSSGSVDARDIQGAVQLDTSYGSISCKNISGQKIAAKSSSGSITAEKIRGSTEFHTSYGGVTWRCQT